MDGEINSSHPWLLRNVKSCDMSLAAENIVICYFDKRVHVYQGLKSYIWRFIGCIPHISQKAILYMHKHFSKRSRILCSNANAMMIVLLGQKWITNTKFLVYLSFKSSITIAYKLDLILLANPSYLPLSEDTKLWYVLEWECSIRTSGKIWFILKCGNCQLFDHNQ